MVSMTARKSAFCAIILAGITQNVFATPVSVPASALIAAAPSAAGTGLNAAYYNNTGLNNNTEADNYINSHAATATFHSTLPRYDSDSVTSGSNANTSVQDSLKISQFLGSDAASLSVVGAGNNTLDTSIFRFTGYIKITQDMDRVAGNNTIDINFRTYSDDGMRLKIGGVTIEEYNAPRGWGYTDGVASFSKAGLYAIDLLYWENGGYTGVNSQWQTGSNTSFQTIATANLYSSLPTSADSARVPEPGTLALAALGFVGLGRRLRRTPK